MPDIECESISETYPGVGLCIYCGKRPPEVGLTREHIIPKAIKGYLKLPSSSCEKCACITKKFEQKCARLMLGHLRIHIGMGWQREQPDELGGIVIKTDTCFSTRKVRIADHPFVMTMIGLDPPGFLRSPISVGTYSRVRFWMRNIQGDTQQRVDRLAAGQAAQIEINQVFPLADFCRMLAKIAHAFACATVRIEHFTPSLLEIIAGRSTDYADWIGGSNELTRPVGDSASLLHNVWVDLVQPPGQLHEPPLVVVSIQLFACLGAPVYQVIVGRACSTELLLRE